MCCRVVFLGRLFMIQYAVKQFVAQWLVCAQQSIRHQGYFRVALSGGKTPISFYRALSQEKKFPWHNTHIYMVDERFVPIDHEDSNQKMIREMLIDRVDAHFYPINTDTKDAETAARKYEHLLKSRRDDSTPCCSYLFDLIILGVGEDGHTASLFPENFKAINSNRLVVRSTSKNHEHERITLTLKSINDAQNIIFLTDDKNKRKIVQEIKNKNKMYPASHVQQKKGALFFFGTT